MERLRDRILARVEMQGTCLVWLGAKTDRGYGNIRVEGKTVGVHRAMYEASAGPIKPGAVIDHKCRNRLCVEPSHLQAVTHKQNAENRSPHRNNLSGFRGVYWHKDKRKFAVCVQHQGRVVHGGYFGTVEAANDAAVALRRSLFTNSLSDE